MISSFRRVYGVVIVGCVACVLGVVTTAARAVNLGGTAEVRAWASAPSLHDPITIRHHRAGTRIVLPGDVVFRYLNAAAGPLTGPFHRYGRYVWEPVGVRNIGADTWSIATATTSDQLTVRIAGGHGYAFRFRVNGSASAIKYLPAKHWETYDVTIRFRDGGRHTVILQMTGDNSDFDGAIDPTKGRLLAPKLHVGPRTIFLGDSWTAGAVVSAPFLGYVQTTAQKLGLGDAWASGIGGTGYVKPGATKITWGQRLQSDVLRWHPATVIVAGGTNDLTSSPSAFKRAVTRLFVRLRRALPHARLFALGPWLYTGIVPPNYLLFNDIIQTAVTAVGGAYISNEAWITGTGSTLRPSRNGGNASIFIGKENHPNVAGYRYIGTRLAQALLALPRDAGLPGSNLPTGAHRANDGRRGPGLGARR